MPKTKVLVHDGWQEIEKEVDAARHAQLTDFVKCNPNVIGDGSDVSGRIVRDAGEALNFLVAQLTYTEAQVYARQYLPTQFRELLPVSNEAGEWAESIRYEKTDFAGQAQWASDASDKFPTANVQYDDKTVAIHHAFAGYRYTLQELRATAYLRRPLNERRMVAAMEMVERFMNKVGLYGDTKKNLQGLFQNSAIPQDIATTGKWDLAATTPLQILADVNAALFTPYKASNYNDVPDTLVIPPLAYQRFVSTPVVLSGGAVAASSILEWLKANNICKSLRNIDLNIVPGFGLETAGAATKGGSVSGSNSRCVVYLNNKDRLVYHVPMPLRFIAPQFEGAAVLVPGEFRLGGVEVRYPSSAFYLDNVLNAG